MNKVKTAILLIFLFFIFNAQCQVESGEYLISIGQIKKVNILIRKDGSMRFGKVDYANDQEEFVFKSMNGSKSIFEGVMDKTNYRIEEKEGIIVLYSLEDSRLITSTNVIAKDKKSLKLAMKKMGIKSAAKLEMEAMINKNKEPLPIKEEYIVKNPTSNFHEKHVNEIVFFAEKPEIGKENESEIRTSFKAGEAVWAIAYLPTELEVFENLHNFNRDNFGNVTRELCVGIDKMDEDLLDEEKAIVNSSGVRLLSEEDLKLNYVIFQVIPALEGEYEIYEYGIGFITERLGERVESYEHTFEIVLTDANMVRTNTKSEMVEIEFIKGEFQYDASAGMEKYLDFSKSIAEAKLKRRKLPTPAMRDENIEYFMQQQIELYAHNKKWDIDVNRVIITSNWQVLKDDYGLIIGNYIQGAVLYSYEGECIYMNFGFIKDYLGGGEFDDYLRQYDIGHRVAVSCDKF